MTEHLGREYGRPYRHEYVQRSAGRRPCSPRSARWKSRPGRDRDYAFEQVIVPRPKRWLEGNNQVVLSTGHAQADHGKCLRSADIDTTPRSRLIHHIDLSRHRLIEVHHFTPQAPRNGSS